LVGILALFAERHRALSSGEIAAALDAPRSSTAALLKTLVDAAVLSLDRRTATYFPGARLIDIAARLSGIFVADDQVLDFAASLQRATDETVILVTPADLAVEIVHVAPGSRRIALVAERGQRFTLWGSAVGSAYLARLPDSTIRSMHQRGVRGPEGTRPAKDFPAILEQVHEVRRLGYAYVRHTVEPGVSAIAAALPEWAGPKPLVVSVGGPEDRIAAQKPAIVATLFEHMAQLERAHSSHGGEDDA